MNAIRIEVLSADELYGRTETEAENADLFEESETASGHSRKRLHYLNSSDSRHQTHVVLYCGDRIVGIAGLQVNPYFEEQIWVQHVSVEEGFRGRGFASRLIEAVYTYAVSHNKKGKAKLVFKAWSAPEGSVQPVRWTIPGGSLRGSP